MIAYYSYPNSNKSEKIARLLIDKGADVNHIMGGHARTPLLTAIWKHNNPVARLLLKNGADPKIPSDRGWDACIYAHRWSNFEIMPDLAGCCQKLLGIEPSADLPAVKLHPPEFLRYCKK